MDVRQKINTGRYDHKLPYPRVPAGMSRRQAIQDFNYIAVREAWNKEERQIIQQFRVDLEEQFSTQNWDRKQQAWDLAWQESHSYGFGEVLNHYIDYVEVFFK